MNEIIELVRRFCINKEIIGENEIRYIINILIAENNLHEHVRDINYCDDDNNIEMGLALYYHSSSLNIDFYIDNIFDYISETFANLSINKRLNYTSYANYIIIRTIFHELRHVIQQKHLSIRDIITKIYEYNDRILDDNFTYMKFHKLFLAEREAFLYEKEQSLSVFSRLDSSIVTKDSIYLLKLDYIRTLLNGYKGILHNTSPLLTFISKITDDNNRAKAKFLYFKEEIEKENMSFIQRLNLGLPITREEYKKLLEIKKMFMSKEENNDIKQLILERGQ